MNRIQMTASTPANTPLDQAKPKRRVAPTKKAGRTEVYVNFNDAKSEDFWGMGFDQEASLEDMRDIEHHYSRYAN